MSNVCKCGHSEENHFLMRGVRRCEGATRAPCACEGYSPESAAKHTPGPWERGLIDVQREKDELASRERVRDAAPQLLEALEKDAARLQRIREVLSGILVLDGVAKAELMDYIHRCALETSAAIAKAEVRP